MASLTQEFDASPQTFIMTHSILVLGGGNPAQPNFQTGAGKFVLEDANTGPGTCFLRKASYIAWDYFNAFLLFASPNNDNVAALPNTVDRFVTNDLSGCQFMAYGPSRDNLTVEHNNQIANNALYAARYAQIQAQHHVIFIALRPVNNANPNADEYNFQLGANVVGVRKADGWHFFVRVATTQHFGGTREI
jgi:hypothetical protein